MVWACKTCPNSEVSVFTRGASAVAVMVSVVAPTSRVMSIRVVSATSKVMPFRTVFLKPGFSAVTSYSPGCRNGAMKFPSAPVTHFEVTLVSTFVMVTVDPGTTAPVGSRTTPCIVAVVACENAGTAAKHTATRRRNMTNPLIESLPEFADCVKRTLLFFASSPSLHHLRGQAETRSPPFAAIHRFAVECGFSITGGLMPIRRRDLWKSAGVAGLMSLASPREEKAQSQVAKATAGMPAPKIKDISVIECQPAGVRLTVVKITTDQPGLYGYGCGTFTQRADLVKPAVERYLKPFLVGKTTDRIEDIWQSCYDSSYWKNGPILNNAISGVDQALWDIKGRQAGMPVYQLVGGKCREAADTYTHASGNDYAQVIESARRFMERGFRNVRVQVGVPGMEGYGGARSGNRVQGLREGAGFEPAPYVRSE